MINLWEKICILYPELQNNSKVILSGDIVLMNLNDGKGDFIAKWNWSDLPKPTQEQLDLISQD